MKFNQINKVILFGGGPLLVELAEWLRDEGIEVNIYTARRHEIVSHDDQGTTMADKLKAKHFSYVVTEDINTETALLEKINENTLGIGMGEAWSFNKTIIDRFNGMLLDYMGIPHPRYRGGAHYTWMILRGDKETGCNLQIINEDMVQGKFDSGDIVKSKRYRLPEQVRVPLDYYEEACKQDLSFLQEFFYEIKEGKEFVLSSPDEARSLFLPRLNTNEQGWIDWSWDGISLERFICAFDEPYAGASTYLNNQRVYMKTAQLDSSEPPFHPFQSGLVTRVTEQEGVVIATQSGHLQVKTILDESGNDIKSHIQIGERFITSAEKLLDALAYKPLY